MNISKRAQRVLHVLAQGGAIHFDRAENGKVQAVYCYTRDGHLFGDCPLDLFERLRKLRLIRSSRGQPYRVTRAGLSAVTSQQNQR